MLVSDISPPPLISVSDSIKLHIVQALINKTYLSRVDRIRVHHALLLTHSELAFGKFNPAASHHITVYHKPDNTERFIKL